MLDPILLSVTGLLLFKTVAHDHLIPLPHILVPITFKRSGLIHLRTIPCTIHGSFRLLIDILGVNNYSAVFLDYSAAAHGSFPGLCRDHICGAIKFINLLTDKVVAFR